MIEFVAACGYAGYSPHSHKRLTERTVARIENYHSAP
jgi:hypothetical protein